MTDQYVHASSLINLLHPQPSAQALVEITGLAGKTRPVKRYFTDGALATEVALELNAAGYSAFINANPRSAMSSFEHDVPYVTALALDLQPERTPIETVFQNLERAGIAPAASVVSGYGAHAYVLVTPSDPQAAKLVWERLCKWTGSDRIFNCNRIMRLPGTANLKKNPARWCYMTGVWPERRYELAHVARQLDLAGAPAARPPAEGIQVPVDPPEDWFEIRKRLKASVLDIIDTGEKNAFSERQVTRSEADFVVVCELVRIGCTDEMIHWVYEKQPVGIMKYRQSGARYLGKTIDAARRAVVTPVERHIARARDLPRRHHGSSGDNRYYRNQR